MTQTDVVIQQEKTPTVKERKENEDGELQAIKIEGLALPFGEESRNGVVYEEESIRNTAEQLIGESILWNHDDDIPALGKVTSTEIREDGMYYEAEIDAVGDLEEKVVRKIERGYIDNVSIQAGVRESENGNTNEVEIVDFYELTVCNIAGFPQTNTDTKGEVTENGIPEQVELNGRNVMPEAVMAEKLGQKEETQKQKQVAETVTEAFKEAPSPSLVLSLYEDEEDAMERAEELGLEGTHSHEVDGETMYMAGESHDEWRDAVEQEMEDEKYNDKDKDDEDESDHQDDEDDEDTEENQNSNKKNGQENDSMTEELTEQLGEIQDTVESIEEKVDDLEERVETVEEEHEQLMEDEGESKQGNEDPEEGGTESYGTPDQQMRKEISEKLAKKRQNQKETRQTKAKARAERF